MKNMIKQFYTEGFATTFYVKPVKYLNKKIENKKIVKFLSILIKIFYTIIVLLLAGIIFYKKWSL